MWLASSLSSEAPQCFTGFSVKHLIVTNIIAYYSDPLSVPRLTVSVATTGVQYQVDMSDTHTTVLSGFEVFRFGVPMIGEYANTGRGKTVTISPVVPGAQYRITAWAQLGNVRRSTTPDMKITVIGEVGE